MTANRDAPRRTTARVLKSPLAAHSRGASGSRVPVPAGAAAHGKRAEMSARAITLHDFADFLLTTSNRMGRPLKGARAAGEGRLIWFTPSTARAVTSYLRARRGHRQAASNWVWLGRGRFSNTGIRKMLERRAAEAGYGRVTPHQFRHTFSHDWLESGGSEGDLMRLNGWKTRAMIDRYTEDLAEERALQAKKRMGDLY